MVLVTAVFVGLALLLGFIAAIVGDLANAVFYLAFFGLWSGYWIVLEAFWGGRTVGKRAFGLRVIADRGLRLTFGQVVLRSLVRIVDLLPGPGGVAALVMTFDREHRRLGDLVAGTLVIRERRVPPPQRIRGLAGERKGRGIGLQFPADLVRKVPPGERDLLLDLCLRRDGLDDGVRHRLFAEVAAHYRPMLDLAAAEGVSDEKLVLLMTAEIYERLGVT